MKAHAQAVKRQQAAGGAVSKTTSLTSEQLTRVFTASAIPFIGFGFLDNLIMVRKLALAQSFPQAIPKTRSQASHPRYRCKSSYVAVLPVAICWWPCIAAS